MKQQRTLSELASEIDRQQKAKADYIANSNAMAMEVAEDEKTPQLALVNGDTKRFPIRDIAHGQIANRLGIPKKYYDRMRDERPQLLAANVNTWLKATDERRMVRTLDDSVRAVLSDRYQRIEHFEIANVALPILAEQPDLQIVSCAITETRLYIKAVFPRVAGEVKKGDVVQAGVVIENSETGQGAASVKRMNFRLVCLNGMIGAADVRALHIGKRAEEGEAVYEMLSDETKAADDRAILLKMRDVVRASASQEHFDKWLERMRESTEERIAGNPIKAVEVLAQKTLLTQDESGSVMRHLIEGGDLSRWGVLNAVTRASQDVEDYDRATQLEALGGQILDLPQSQWREIAEAA